MRFFWVWFALIAALAAAMVVLVILQTAEFLP